jgi:ketosteroid isomerase-like protein
VSEDRIEAARHVVQQLLNSPDWDAAIDDDIPPELADLFRGTLEAYRRGDVEWLLEHTDPQVEIVQMPEVPDSRSYRGHDGFIDALLDWPRQWEDFRVEPVRVFAVGQDQLLVDQIHRGRPRSVDIEVEARVVFATRWREGRLTNWDMFLTLEEALSRAAQRRAHGDDDHATERDGPE